MQERFAAVRLRAWSDGGAIAFGLRAVDCAGDRLLNHSKNP